jgi:hypothetical protein
MWNNRKRSPLHIFHRDRRRQPRRPAFEALERRDCPAVQAVFAGGVLTVVGDERNNVIELYQPRDRVVEVSGDGQTWVFEAVDEVFVDAGDGDDHATSSKPKEIVVVGSKIKMQMGAGSDTVKIADGSVDSRGRGITSFLTIDLGVGDDAFAAAFTGGSMINLSLTAGPGNDTAVIDGLSNTILFGERPSTRIVVDLGAGNDDFKLQTTELGDVEFDLTAGDGNDSVQVGHQMLTQKLWGVSLHISLGAGADRLQAEMEGYGDVNSLIDAGPGDDEVALYTQAGGPITFVRDFRSSGMIVDLGDGADQLSVESTDFADVTQNIRGGNGSDQVILSDRVGPFFQFESKRLRQQIHTGAGNDLVLNDSAGSEEVQTTIDVGSGDDVVLARYTWAYLVQRPRDTQLNLALSLGAGSDVAMLDGTGYRALVCVFYAGPAQDGRDFVAASFRLTPFERMRRFRQVTDGGTDLFELLVGAGYNVQMTSGHESITVILTRTEN